MELSKFEEDDRILFEGRKTPLTVKEAEDEELLVEGPKGGEYRIYTENGTLLYSKPGNERYSSYCKNLRKVGEWKKEGNKWLHTKTEAIVKVEKKENGFWEIKSEKFQEEIDNPHYGFSNKEAAVEEAEKFVSDRPEG